MEWQLITTMPKGGVRVILYTPRYRYLHFIGIGWLNKDGFYCWEGLPHNPAPTHWMPLPGEPEINSSYYHKGKIRVDIGDEETES